MRRAVFTLAALLVGCRAEAPPASTKAPPEGVRAETIASPEAYLARFTELVPPLGLNTTANRRLETRVYYRLPEEGAIAWTKAGLRFPPGTVAERVDRWRGDEGQRILDIRGTQITASGGQELHVFRPLPSGGLYGVHWPAEAHHRLGDAALEHLAAVTGADLEGMKRKNDCVGCHARSQREALDRIVRRATDADGFYIARSVLEDSAPLEAYHALDPNEGADFVSLECPPGFDGAWRDHHASCTGPDGERGLPRARYDLQGALAAGAPRAEQVCESRRFLWRHLDEAGRRVIAARQDPCAEDGALSAR